MALGAVLDDDECECDPHDSSRDSSARCPVVGYPLRPVEIIPNKLPFSKDLGTYKWNVCRRETNVSKSM